MNKEEKLKERLDIIEMNQRHFKEYMEDIHKQLVNIKLKLGIE